MAQIGDPRAIEPLFNAQPLPPQNEVVVEALILLAPSDPRTVELAIQQVIYGSANTTIETFLQEIDPPPVDFWINGFLESDYSTPNRIIKEVQQMECSLYTEIMMGLLTSDNPVVQESAQNELSAMLFVTESECIRSTLADELVKTISTPTENLELIDNVTDLISIIWYEERDTIFQALKENAEGLIYLLNNSGADQEFVMTMIVSAGIDPYETLLAALENENAEIRAMAVSNLGRLGNPAAIPSLGRLVKDKNVNVRIKLADAFGILGDDSGVPFLERLLFDSASGDQYSVKVQINTVDALGKIRSESSIGLLIHACGNTSYDFRRSACRTLSGMDRSLVSPLLQAIQNRNLKIIVDAYPFFLLWGEENSEVILIEALKQLGTSNMASAFLNCGNPLLKEAAKQWAEENGFSILTLPSFDSDLHAWGSGR